MHRSHKQLDVLLFGAAMVTMRRKLGVEFRKSGLFGNDIINTKRNDYVTTINEIALHDVAYFRYFC